MMNSYYKKAVVAMLHDSGITVNGSQPYDIQVHDERFYKRFLRDGRLGIGESYVDGWWDCDDIDNSLYKIGQQMRRIKTRNFGFLAAVFLSKIVPYGSVKHSRKIGDVHYDIGNNLYQFMLDSRMVYTCAYWPGAQNLDEAQEQKLELVCRKLMLKPGMHILDVGCGWGSFAKYAAERYNVRVTGISVSQEQITLGQELCKGLPVSLQYEDYRETKGQYDRIVSLGMFEHVGLKYHRVFMKKMKSLLKEDGIFLLHTIGSNHSHFSNPWLEKYIFPGCFSPSIKHIGQSIEELFVMEDWHNIGPNYYQTLLHWYHNFNEAWPKLSEKYNERFYRMWKFYLLSMAPAFRARFGQVWQIVLTHKGLEGDQAAQLRLK